MPDIPAARARSIATVRLSKKPAICAEFEDVVMIPRAAEVISAANQRSLPVVMVTNPSGIGRGYYGWTEFKCVRTRLSFRSSRRARELMRFAPARTIPMRKACRLIRIIRHASPIPVCFCRQRPISESI